MDNFRMFLTDNRSALIAGAVVLGVIAYIVLTLVIPYFQEKKAYEDYERLKAYLLLNCDSRYKFLGEMTDFSEENLEKINTQLSELHEQDDDDDDDPELNKKLNKMLFSVIYSFEYNIQTRAMEYVGHGKDLILLNDKKGVKVHNAVVKQFNSAIECANELMFFLSLTDTIDWIKYDRDLLKKALKVIRASDLRQFDAKDCCAYCKYGHGLCAMSSTNAQCMRKGDSCFELQDESENFNGYFYGTPIVFQAKLENE